MDAPTAVQRTLVCAACLSVLREAPWPRCARYHFPRGTGRVPDSGCLECAGWPGCLVDPLAARMARLCPLPARDALVVPVATTRGQARRRGYNQAELLAREYAARTSAPGLDALTKEGEGPSQVELTPDQQRRNVRDSFTVRPNARAAVRGRAVALIDDVLTTGATMAEALERMGARGVTVIAFARALPGRDGLP